MPVPLETEKRITQALAQVKQSPDHHLDSAARFTVYQSFGPSTASKVLFEDGFYLPVNYSEADMVFNWLGVLTARKVLPAWEELDWPAWENGLSRRNPKFWLEAAEMFLNGDAHVEDLQYLIMYRSSGLVTRNIGKYFTEPVYYSVAIPRQLVQILLMEFDEQVNTRFTNPYNDLAANAVRAFAGLDQNEAGMWVNARVEEVEGYVPLSYDPGRALEFWEWWLQAAIPQAWELASLHK